MTGTATFRDETVGVRTKLSALWASVTLCYLYGDYFALYIPGKLAGMVDGIMGPLGPTSQGVLLKTAAMMAIPCVMVFLSTIVPTRLNRWLNIVLGSLFTIIMIATMVGAWRFYIFLGVVEIVLTILIVWHAWNWPRATSSLEVAQAAPLAENVA